MTRVVLRLFDLLAWALRASGVDYPQFRALLEVKLTLDGRRQTTAFRTQPGKAPRNALLFTLVINTFMGLFVAMFLGILRQPLLALTIVHAFIMMMIALSLISDFSSVLLDTTDNQILQPRPVTSRTLLAARTAHIVVYIALLSGSLALPALVVGGIKFGVVFVPAFLFTLLLSIAMILNAVNLLYLLLMRWISGERLRDIILYFQVAMTVIAMGGYQVVPRLMNAQMLKGPDISAAWWIYLVPPAWLAGAVDLAIGNWGAVPATLTGLAVAVSAVLWVLVTRLAPGFREALARLDAAPAKSTVASGQMRASARRTIFRYLCRRPTERAAFELLWALSSRDRQFKLRTYPSAAFAIVFGCLFMFMPGGNARTLAEVVDSRLYLFMLYFACLMAPTALMQMAFSDQREAAWIYRALPLARPGEVLVAGLKVIVVKLIVPTFLVLTAITLVLWGVRTLPDVALALGVTLLMAGLQALLVGRRMPFSEAFAVRDSSGRATRAMVIMLASMAVGGLHFALTFVPYGVPAAIVPIVALAWLTIAGYRRTRWAQVLRTE
jgi:hypothetical protein